MATATSACASAGASFGASRSWRQASLALVRAISLQFRLRGRLGEKAVDTGFGGDRAA